VKIVEIQERAGDGDALDRPLFAGCWLEAGEQAVALPFVGETGLDGELEASAFLGRDRGPCAPRRIGRWRDLTPGSMGLVGQAARAFEVVAGPVAGPVVAGGEVVGAGLERAGPGFDRAREARCGGRRAEVQEAEALEYLQRVRAEVLASAVALEDQRSAVFDEERSRRSIRRTRPARSWSASGCRPARRRWPRPAGPT
jgi:hypothetical protein